MSKTTSLEETKIEDASYGLKTLIKEIVWLEQNGWSIVQTSDNDIVGQGVGIYNNKGSVDIHIHLMKNVTHESPCVLFEDKTTMKILSE